MKIAELSEPRSNSEIMEDFIRFAYNELELASLPKIELIATHVSNEESNSFAAYSPGDRSVKLYTKGRHILDVLRSLCHEFVHYKQDIEGRLKVGSGATGSDHENEANALAGQIMRKYGRAHPELF